jgi:hypothetical protein
MWREETLSAESSSIEDTVITIQISFYTTSSLYFNFLWISSIVSLGMAMRPQATKAAKIPEQQERG